jgi:hypothetical protein
MDTPFIIIPQNLSYVNEVHTMPVRPLFHPRDFWLVGGILILALVLYAVFSYLNRYDGQAAGQISVDGSVVLTAGLQKYGELALPGNPMIRFTVCGRGIAFSQSDCRDRSCVRAGPLNRPGQAAACLPNRTALLVAGRSGADDFDAVTH